MPIKEAVDYLRLHNSTLMLSVSESVYVAEIYSCDGDHFSGWVGTGLTPELATQNVVKQFRAREQKK